MPRPAPSPLELLRHECDAPRAAAASTALRDLRRRAREAEDARRELIVAPARARARRSARRCARPSPTPLNRAIGPHRRFDWLAMDLADVKARAQARSAARSTTSCSPIVTGAVRRFLDGAAVNADRLDFRVMAPVCVRARRRDGRARQPRLGLDRAAADRRAPIRASSSRAITAHTARAEGVEAARSAPRC